MKVFKVEYFSNGNLTRSVVIARNMQQAIDFIVNEDEVTSGDISKCEVVKGAGKILTWRQPD
ncbi:hypothetical protein B4065_0138 [Caldibacillus thermoamylovorans]|uniref:hypothetical protein n=1 Tax=Caldibacillus thermoamylovorans TaxID=35841 RepID=UPI0005A470A9|nr:hypothetical protein [Caldibacillus thermoamylovorans]KIO60212.1 hypothetical protein B4065_0138 [Caldibacillus thermoamylovorans]